MKKAGDRLKEARLAAGYDTAIAACEAFGWKEITYRAHESGGRGMRKDVAQRYARAFKVSPAWLLIGDGNIDKINLTENIDRLEVIGVSYAGIWRDNSLGVPAMKNVPRVGADPRFPAESQYLIKVEGNSMDLVAEDGSFAHCVDFPATGRSFQDGNLVLAVRTKTDGTQETTIKLIKLKNGKIELWPRSSDPKHKPIMDNGDPDITVQVKAIILRFYGPDKI